MAKKVVLYGAGELTKRFLKEETRDYEVIAIFDQKWKSINIVCGHKVYDPEVIAEFEFEYVIIALDDLKIGMDNVIEDIYTFLINKGIEENKIILQSFKSLEHHINRYPRKEYLFELSKLQQKQCLGGDVAECGVFRGWFAAMINEFYKDKKLWLFDTFEGFDIRDVTADTDEAKSAIKRGEFDRFNTTSEEIVRLRCMYREKLVFKKGYIPDTFKDVDSEFCFVNLDMDLYVPQLAALRFFSKRMVKGGVILVHDYYNDIFTGTKKAVDEFYNEIDSSIVRMTPIGDGLSIALLF